MADEYVEIQVQTVVQFNLKVKKELAAQMTHDDVAETLAMMIEGVEYEKVPVFIDSVQHEDGGKVEQYPRYDIAEPEDYEIVSIDRGDFPKIDEVW